MTKRKKDPLSFLFFQTGYFQAWMISTLQRTRTHPLLLSEVQDFLLCLLLFHPLIMGEKQRHSCPGQWKQSQPLYSLTACSTGHHYNRHL